MLRCLSRDGSSAYDHGFAVRYVPQVCGDRLLASAEACDDGNLAPGIGCSGTCQAEPAVLYASEPAVLEGTTLSSTLEGTRAFFGSCVGEGGLERLFSFTAPASGALRVALESRTRQGIYLRRGCIEELDCAVPSSPAVAAIASGHVEAGEVVPIVVDGASPASAGPFRLTALFDDE